MRSVIVVLAVVLVVEGASALAAQERGGEHPEAGEGGGGDEGGGEGAEAGGGDGEESGTLYGLGDTARQSRGGVDLVLRYDAPAEAFVGTVRNTTTAPIDDVRVEVHLSNGVELGPTPRRDLAPGAVADVRLDARGQSFQRWSVHVEIGQSEPEPVPALSAVGVGALAFLLLAGGRRHARRPRDIGQRDGGRADGQHGPQQSASVASRDG